MFVYICELLTLIGFSSSNNSSGSRYSSSNSTNRNTGDTLIMFEIAELLILRR